MCHRASLIAQLVKNTPAMQETPVQFLGREDPLEKEMATHSSILAWRIPWTEEPGRLQSMRSQRVRHNLVTKSPPSLTMDWLHFPVVILIGVTSKKFFMEKGRV